MITDLRDNVVVEDNPQRAQQSGFDRETTTAKMPLSAAEQKAIRDRAEKLEESLQEGELANMTTIHDKKWPETVIYGRKMPAARRFILRISPPTRAQIDAAYATLAAATNEVHTNPAAKEQMSAKLRSIINTYFSFPKATKFLIVTLDGQEERVVEVVERYVDDESLISVLPDGNFTFPPADKSVGREDARFYEVGSWASKRYSHIFQSTPDNGVN